MEAPAQAQASSPRGGRRTFVVDRRFQLKYTLLLVGVGVVIAALFGTVMYLVYVSALRAYVEGRSTTEATASLVWALLAISVAMAAALSLVGVVITHRVAGPVHVMTHYLNVLGGGRYPILRPLRKGDELQRFFEAFQGAVESMRSREAGEADTLHAAVARLAPLASTDEARLLLEQLQAMHDRKRDATDRVDVGRTE
ncbi:MAG TPA: signal protein [Myxococcales bacterium]|jgi:hypothetical protein|nr:signal protein [Myxococcales bacterium]